MKKSYIPEILGDAPIGSRYFLKIFKRKEKIVMREGTLSPDELRKVVKELGRNTKVNITRLTYDGTPEDQPINIKIVDIREDHFVGKVVNVERTIKQSEDANLVYVKGGGGTIEFFFNDGDIKSIDKDIDQTIIVEQRNVGEIKEILDALDLNEDIMISYYDQDSGGVINGVGQLIAKDLDNLDFKIRLSKINEIDLNKPKEVSLNLEKDSVLDLEIVI